MQCTLPLSVDTLSFDILPVQVFDVPKDVMLSYHISHLLHLETLCNESDPLRPPCSHKYYQIY